MRGVVSTSPNTQDRGPTHVGCPLLLIQYIFVATHHIEGRSSIRNLRTRHAVVTGTHLSRDFLHLYVCVYIYIYIYIYIHIHTHTQLFFKHK